KKKAEIGPASTAEKREKRLRPLGRQYCRIGVEPLFSTKRLGGWGLWLKDAGRGSQESPTSCVIAVTGKAKLPPQRTPVRLPFRKLKVAQGRLRSEEETLG